MVPAMGSSILVVSPERRGLPLETRHQRRVSVWFQLSCGMRPLGETAGQRPRVSSLPERKLIPMEPAQAGGVDELSCGLNPVAISQPSEAPSVSESARAGLEVVSFPSRIPSESESGLRGSVVVSSWSVRRSASVSAKRGLVPVVNS